MSEEEARMQSERPEPRFLTVAEVAERLRLSRTTVYRMTQAGALPGFKIGGQWRFDVGYLEHWLASQSARWQQRLFRIQHDGDGGEPIVLANGRS